MAKDPAFLFYTQDFLVGVQTMDFPDRGKYITLLCMMHQQGRMDEFSIKFLIGDFTPKLKAKFKMDKHGLYYNDRLELEVSKRIKYTESRRKNANGGKKKRKAHAKHMDTHMENENVNEIILFINKKIGTDFKADNANTIYLIDGLLKKYTMEDLKNVVEVKCREWLPDEKMRIFLRPETLFGDKFEGYLQQFHTTGNSNGKLNGFQL